MNLEWTKHVRWTMLGFIQRPLLSLRNTVIVLTAFVWTALVGGIMCTILFWRLNDRIFGLSRGWSEMRRAHFTWWAAHTYWVRILLKIARVKLEVEGFHEHFDPERRYVIVANHQSTLDILLLVSLIPHAVIVAKHEVTKYPIVGWAVKWGAMIVVDRGNHEQAMDAVRCGLRDLGGESWLVFPEGTRTLDGNMKDFKYAPFVVATEECIAILPIVFGPETFNSLPKGSLLRLKPRPVIRITFLPVIETIDFIRERTGRDMGETRQELLLYTRAKMIDVFESQREAT
ncbi:MAG: 1-acyl-sn-glycerol-3-phosphate acyltransferase [bacterium]|nr:1-acyl-sn-glycerol-3-phosphate acyltransferase [bacterium]